MRVSATLIVRDESSFIYECLDSLSGVVDEIVVVDTGSRDDTIQKASHFPIKLCSFQWCNDFSAARNFAIAQASGEWILYIDADERLEIPNRRIWHEVVSDESKAAWKLRFYPRVSWTPYAELRLFRNHPSIRFRGVIHERVHAGAHEVCRSDGLEIGSCEMAIHHVGYESDQSHKLSRNIPLLRTYLSQEPERIYCWCHLGEMLQLAGDEDGAEEAWSKGIEVARAEARGCYSLSNSMPFVSLIVLRHNRGVSVDALLEEGLRLFPDQLFLQWVAAKLSLERGQGETVRPLLEKLAAIDADNFYDSEISYDKALFSYACRESLALCHFRAARFAAAADWYHRAASAAPNPQSCEVKAMLAEAKSATTSAPEDGLSAPKPTLRDQAPVLVD